MGLILNLDNFRAWRPDAGCVNDYEDALTNYPAGIHVLAESENLSIHILDPTND